MSGRKLFIGFLIFFLIFGSGLFYTINYAYYNVSKSEIYDLETDIGVLPLYNVERLEGTTTALKMRICADAIDLGAFEEAGDAQPLVAPFWFKCFDARKLTEALANTEAEARMIHTNVPWGFNLYAANMLNKTYIWRQLNECGDAKFSGDPIPEICPVESE